MGGWVEILFPISEIDDPQTRAWFVDGGANQSWSNIFGSGGSFAPGAVPHQIGTDTVLQFTPPPPPPPPTPPQCLANFQWGSNYIPANGLSTLLAGTAGQSQTNQLDQYGNLYVNTDKATLVFDPNGNVIASLNQKWLADGVDAWFGSAVVRRPPTFDTIARAFYATPILDGQYIVAFFQADTPPEAFGAVFFAYWYVILQPNPGAPPTVIGAVWYEGIVGPPYASYLHFMGIANQESINDPIMIRGSFGIGATAWCIALLPSVSAIINGTYKANGFATYNSPCKVPQVRYYPIGNTTLSTNLFSISFSPEWNVKSGFVLPNSSGGTNVYFYISRRSMDGNATTSVIIANPEIRNVLQPAYPTGCIIKINMGVLDYQTAASFAFTHGGSASTTGTGMYTVDNAAWNDGTSAQVPFVDEYTYLSNNTTGGVDGYVMQPGAIINRGGGLYWVIFYMPGQTDARDNNLDRLYERVRIFQYNSSTEVATQILEATCVLYLSSQVPTTKPNGSFVEEEKQAWSISDNGSGLITLHVDGYTATLLNTSSIVYKTDFLQFTP